jgi:hypothetical protein
MWKEAVSMSLEMFVTETFLLTAPNHWTDKCREAGWLAGNTQYTVATLENSVQDITFESQPFSNETTMI